MKDCLLTANGISRSYGDFEALRDLTFRAHAADIIGLLGPNGAGKTTAIRVLTTILPPSAGTFSICGIPQTRPADIRRMIGVIPESSGFPGRQTGEEYLSYFARLYGQSRHQALNMTGKLLEVVGLTPRANSPIHTYSRGMRQRLAFARALVNDPRVIFLDEPTLGLDPPGQRDIMSIIKEIASEQGKAVIISTHLLSEVEQVCSTAIILNEGHIVANDSVSQIKKEAVVPQSGSFQVPPEYFDKARTLMSDVHTVKNVKPYNQQSGILTATFIDDEKNSSLSDVETGVKDIVTTFSEAHIPILSFVLESAPLNEAFFSAIQKDNRMKVVE